MRRKIRPIKIDAPEAIDPRRKVAGVEPTKWCPSFDHRGPWVPEGGLVAPDNSTATARAAIESTSTKERCEWCGHVRELTPLELRRRLRPRDLSLATQIRGREQRSTLTQRDYRRPRFWPTSATPKSKVFLLYTNESNEPGVPRRHLVDREKTFCGADYDVDANYLAWDEWAGPGGRGKAANRCPACHERALALSDEQLDLAFAYMVLIGRLATRRHPNDNEKHYDLETGRALLREEWTECHLCDGKGTRPPNEVELREHYGTDSPAPVVVRCDPCGGLGWFTKEIK